MAKNNKMFGLFIVLLGFSKSLITKCLFLNNEPCIISLSIINMNPNSLNIMHS